MIRSAAAMLSLVLLLLAGGLVLAARRGHSAIEIRSGDVTAGWSGPAPAPVGVPTASLHEQGALFDVSEIDLGFVSASSGVFACEWHSGTPTQWERSTSLRCRQWLLVTVAVLLPAALLLLPGLRRRAKSCRSTTMAILSVAFVTVAVNLASLGAEIASFGSDGTTIRCFRTHPAEPPHTAREPAQRWLPINALGRPTTRYEYHGFETRLASFATYLGPVQWTDHSSDPGAGPGQTAAKARWCRALCLELSIWLVLPLLTIWPLVVFVLQPVRRWRRNRRVGHCRTCGYDLTGNVSGVCPECGTEIEQPA